MHQPQAGNLEDIQLLLLSHFSLHLYTNLIISFLLPQHYPSLLHPDCFGAGIVVLDWSTAVVRCQSDLPKL